MRAVQDGIRPRQEVVPPRWLSPLPKSCLYPVTLDGAKMMRWELLGEGLCDHEGQLRGRGANTCVGSMILCLLRCGL